MTLLIYEHEVGINGFIAEVYEDDGREKMLVRDEIAKAQRWTEFIGIAFG